MIYVDKDGRIFWLIPVAAALVGGTINVIQNWDKIDGNWLKGIGYFALGAGNAALSVTVPGYAWAGGAALGFGNTLLGGGGFGDALLNAGISALSSYAGSQVGKYAGNLVSKLNFTLNGFYLGHALEGFCRGSIVGYATSATSAGVATLLRGGSLNEAIDAAHSAGKTGFFLGCFAGFGMAYSYSVKNGIDAFTTNRFIHNVDADVAVLGPYKTQGNMNYIEYAHYRGYSYFSTNLKFDLWRNGLNYEALDLWGSNRTPIEFSTPLNQTLPTSFVRIEAAYLVQNYNYEWIYDVEGNIIGMSIR